MNRRQLNASAESPISPYASINATLQRIALNGTEFWMFDVHQGGPAHLAGIRPGDLLVRYGEREIRPPEDLIFSSGQSGAGKSYCIVMRLGATTVEKSPYTTNRVGQDRECNGLIATVNFPIARDSRRQMLRSSQHFETCPLNRARPTKSDTRHREQHR